MLAEPHLEAGGAGALGSQWAAQAPAHPSTPSSATRQLRLQPGLSFPLPGRAGLALRQPQHVEPPICSMCLCMKPLLPIFIGIHMYMESELVGLHQIVNI